MTDLSVAQAQPGRAWPAEGPARAPYWVFTDPAIYAREQERIFRGSAWHFIGLEAEVPQPGSFKANRIGDTPVVLTRGEDGRLNAMVNRCAHRGNIVCRDELGQAKELYCVYHAWVYNLQGDLTAAAFRRGIRGEGGLPADFRLEDHGLHKLRVESFCGLVFASFDPHMAPLADWLGEVGEGIRRVLKRPLKVLGYDTQRIHANWKNYHENPRDSFHANILHTFYGTFGLSRQSQESAMVLDREGRHVYFYTKVGTDKADASYKETASGLRSHNADFNLADRSLLQWKDEFGDGINIQILSLYPTFVLHQVSNSLATRQLVTYSPTCCDLHWTYFGFEDDTPEMTDLRLFHQNLVGSAGLVSMEDASVCEMIRRSIADGREGASFMEMGGKDLTGGGNTKLSEKALRNFWNTYRRQMEL
jgi:phenylpropionate dioxygenase-like ring-hydroxylating dioxygenase large terminal subunit